MVVNVSKQAGSKDDAVEVTNDIMATDVAV
jgi:hypothetical protein